VEASVSALGANCRVAENVVPAVLPNGLRVLVKENHSAPVVALLVAVQVGYFNEPDRLNGLSHLIEHMMFKGTPRRREDEQIAREVRELGGLINAGTYYEETSYYVVAPSQHLERLMEIQADAVQNSLFDAGELAKEIEVVVQESLQKRDNPTAMLYETLYSLAYDVHRIRRWRIGHPETLRALTRDDLVQFVQETYRPENMILAIVGAVDAEQALTLARRYWGDVPRGTLKREISPVEPPREGFRYRRMTGDTRQRLLLMGLPAPSILHPDAPPLMVLGALLSDGRSARLYRRLKEELRLVNSAWASYEGFEQMGLFTLGAESIGDDPLPVERALWAEVERIRREPVDAEELERVKTRIETRRLTAQEEVLGVARTLATYEALGDYRLADAMLERLRAVTADDVRRVANTYLQLSRAALLEYLPAMAELPFEPTAAEVESALRAEERPGGAEAVLEPPRALELHPEGRIPCIVRNRHVAEVSAPQEIALPNGGKLLYKARRDLPLVSIYALFRGGRRLETRANAGITNLMLKSGMKGTRSFTAEEIANRIEGLGSGIGMSLAPDYFGYGIKLRKEALREGFPILAEVMTCPKFAPEEVEREKQSIYAEIRRQQDNNFALAYDLFASACYGEHPYGLPANGIAEAVADLGPDDLRAWHARHLVAENLVVGIVGDIEAEEAAELFADLLPVSGTHAAAFWGAAGESPEEPAERATYRQKQQTAAVLGFPGASLFHPDRYALDLLEGITSGMGGRFFRTVRGENALAYQVTSFHRARLNTGNFIAYTATSPENEEKARELLLSECERLGREFVGPEELAAAKAAILGEHIIGTQTFGAQAGELATSGIYGLPPDEPQRYLARIEATTAEEVRAAAARYLQPDRYWLGVVRGGAEAEE